MKKDMKWVFKLEFGNKTTERVCEIYILWQNMEILGIRNTAFIM
jgi:hypothetical protein